MKQLDELAEKEDVEKCECCGYPIEGAPFKMCVSAKELIDLGVGFPLYFQFIKYVFLLFFFGFIPFGVVIMYMANTNENSNPSGLEMLSIYGLCNTETYYYDETGE